MQQRPDQQRHRQRAVAGDPQPARVRLVKHQQRAARAPSGGERRVMHRVPAMPALHTQFEHQHQQHADRPDFPSDRVLPLRCPAHPRHQKRQRQPQRGMRALIGHPLDRFPVEIVRFVPDPQRRAEPQHQQRHRAGRTP
ncbi:MAG: hypothetical protein ACK5QX_07855 [bacterium]